MTSRRIRSKSSPSSRRNKRKPGSRLRVRQPRRVPLGKGKGELCRFPRVGARRENGIHWHGGGAGGLIGFKSEEDWFEYRLENHPEFLRQIQEARAALRAGQRTRLEDVTK